MYTHGATLRKKVSSGNSTWNAISMCVKIEDLWIDAISKGKHKAWDVSY